MIRFVIAVLHHCSIALRCVKCKSNVRLFRMVINKKTCYVMSGLNHVQRVRLLYKTILRLHRGLPKELQELGQAYTRDEFRRHKNCNPKEAQIFMLEWSKYTLTLSEQLLKNAKSNIGFGKNIDKDDGILDSFTDDQIVQLYNLFKETTGTQDKTIESELSK